MKLLAIIAFLVTAALLPWLVIPLMVPILLWEFRWGLVTLSFIGCIIAAIMWLV